MPSLFPPPSGDPLSDPLTKRLCTDASTKISDAMQEAYEASVTRTRATTVAVAALTTAFLMARPVIAVRLGVQVEDVKISDLAFDLAKIFEASGR